MKRELYLSQKSWVHGPDFFWKSWLSSSEEGGNLLSPLNFGFLTFHLWMEIITPSSACPFMCVYVNIGDDKDIRTFVHKCNELFKVLNQMWGDQ